MQPQLGNWRTTMGSRVPFWPHKVSMEHGRCRELLVQCISYNNGTNLASQFPTLDMRTSVSSSGSPPSLRTVANHICNPRLQGHQTKTAFRVSPPVHPFPTFDPIASTPSAELGLGHDIHLPIPPPLDPASVQPNVLSEATLHTNL